MRNAVYHLISSDQEIINLGVQTVYASPGIDTPEEETFIVLRWGARNPEFSDAPLLSLRHVSTQDLLVWIHAKEANYNRINRILERIKTLMANALHVPGSDGVLRQAKWTGDSPDLRDDGFHTFTRNSGYRCNGDHSVQV